jgi:outer membrane biosynthesis protein TonB
MKRCPECEFVYEDDQSLCDMDGILLVFDSQQLPKPIDGSAKVSKSRWRNRVVPALAALVLATVLYLVYYVSMQPVRQTYAPAGTQVAPSPVAEQSPPVVNDETQVSVAPKDESVSTPSPVAKVSKEEKPKTDVAPAAKPSKSVVKETKEKPKEKAPQKKADEEDSKIGSLLKKTGRILKKPFKL